MPQTLSMNAAGAYLDIEHTLTRAAIILACQGANTLFPHQASFVRTQSTFAPSRRYSAARAGYIPS